METSAGSTSAGAFHWGLPRCVWATRSGESHSPIGRTRRRIQGHGSANVSKITGGAAVPVFKPHCDCSSSAFHPAAPNSTRRFARLGLLRRVRPAAFTLFGLGFLLSPNPAEDRRRCHNGDNLPAHLAAELLGELDQPRPLLRGNDDAFGQSGAKDLVPTFRYLTWRANSFCVAPATTSSRD